jgi:hypothetical protein
MHAEDAGVGNTLGGFANLAFTAGLRLTFGD